MKRNLASIVGMSLLVLSASFAAFAQNDATLSSAAGDLYVISAKAGGVNYVDGNVTVMRMNGQSGILVKGDQLETGDRITTGARSRAEILLNPGSYARLDQNSEFEFLTTSLDDLHLNVIKGSALFEVFASNDFKVTVSTPKARFNLVKSGVYRIDVLEGGGGRLEVRRGRASVSGAGASVLKKGRSATMNGDEVAVARFNRGQKDSFESWSKGRAKLIAKANKKLKAKILSNSLLRGFRADRWDCYSSLGLWVYSRRYNAYSFLPFGLGWRSPYGYGLRTSTGICYDPFYYYYQRPYRAPRGGGGQAPVETRRRQTPQANIDRGTRSRTPPFQRVQRSGSVKVMRQSRRSGRSGFPSMGTGRTMTRTTTTTTNTQKSSSSDTKGKQN